MTEQRAEGGPPRPLTRRDLIDVLLEEYRAMYSLLLFRLDAMDRRLPIAGGGIVILLASLAAIPDELRLATLVVLPASLAWLVWTTVNHARSKEDHLRRIEDIEHEVNKLADGELLVFQSQHPNLKCHVAGRTGSGTVAALAAASLSVLLACHVLFTSLQIRSVVLVAYDVYLLAAAAFVVICWQRFRTYRYRRAAFPSGSPKRQA